MLYYICLIGILPRVVLFLTAFSLGHGITEPVDVYLATLMENLIHFELYSQLIYPK